MSAAAAGRGLTLQQRLAAPAPETEPSMPDEDTFEVADLPEPSSALVAIEQQDVADEPASLEESSLAPDEPAWASPPDAQAPTAATPVPAATALGERAVPAEPRQDLAQRDPTLAIGHADVEVVNCPNCDRPLAAGTSRCPNCGIRLVRGVPVRRNRILAVVAVLVVGVVAVGASAAALSVVLAPSSTATATPTGGTAVVPSAAPSTAVRPPSTPGAASIDPQVGIPQPALAALAGTALVNSRITTDGANLTATLAQKDPPTIDIARALRALSADATQGTELTQRLAAWADAASVATQLQVFYKQLADATRTALRASLADEEAYRKSGAAIVELLAGLSDVDGASRALAASVALELPPLVVEASPSTTP